MKKLLLSLIAIHAANYKDVSGGPVAQNYVPTNPPSGQYQNSQLNPYGSQYAAETGKNVTSIIQRAVRQVIFDAAPAQYMDLKIMNLKAPQKVMSDEFHYHEMGFGREPILNAAIGSAISAATSQVVPILNKATVHPDMIIVYPTNERGTITTITPTGGQGANITITAMTGETLPTIPISAAGAYVFSNLSPVEADGADSISQYVRYETIERTNYVQMLVKAMRFGKMELAKYQNNGQLNNFLTMQRKRMYEQFRISLSNVYWNGKRGEVTLKSGAKAKTAGGVFPIMQEAGSANLSTSLVNLPTALERLALGTEYGEYGQTRFLYGVPNALLQLSKAYKSDLTRYTPNDMVAKLMLNQIDFGSTKVVLVPMARFKEPSCFPTSFASKLILLDQSHIQPVYLFPEESGSTLNRRNNGNLNNFTDEWVSNTFSIEFYNPLACGWIDITNL